MISDFYEAAICPSSLETSFPMTDSCERVIFLFYQEISSLAFSDFLATSLEMAISSETFFSLGISLETSFSPVTYLESFCSPEIFLKTFCLVTSPKTSCLGIFLVIVSCLESPVFLENNFFYREKCSSYQESLFSLVVRCFVYLVNICVFPESIFCRASISFFLVNTF